MQSFIKPLICEVCVVDVKSLGGVTAAVKVEDTFLFFPLSASKRLSPY